MTAEVIVAPGCWTSLMRSLRRLLHVRFDGRRMMPAALTSAGDGPECGLVGVRLQVPSDCVTFSTRSVWVAYTQWSGPTATRSPRVPLLITGVSVGGLVDRSTFVMLPSLRFTIR